MKSNKKYFVVSDTHSFATILKESLEKAGFDINNSNHILIILGDVFDRGDETLEMYDFIKSISKDRLILVRGNHEYLYLELLEKSFPSSADFHNCTVKTFCDIAHEDAEQLTLQYWLDYFYSTDIKYLLSADEDDLMDTINKKRYTIWNRVLAKVHDSEITSWIKSSDWLNYYELDNYIFVHSFIPLKENNKLSNYFPTYKYMSDWREASDTDWYYAMWKCPFELFDRHLFDEEIKNNKILVCGHWTSSDFHSHYENETQYNYNTYYSKNLIALDACTAMSLQINVLVLDDKLKIVK